MATKKEKWYEVIYFSPERGREICVSSRARCPVCGNSPCYKKPDCKAAKTTGKWRVFTISV